MLHRLTEIRYLPALVVGFGISLGLFLLMHSLIANTQQPNVNSQQVNLVGFVQVKHEDVVRRKQYEQPKKPPPPKNPPPKEKVQVSKPQASRAAQLPTNIKLDTNSLSSGAGVYIGMRAPESNAEGYAPLTPVARVKPMYPPQAAFQRVEGQVNTCFTVEPDGSVSNPRVVGASSPAARQLLAQAALQTILQWKFFPKKVNGQPVATSNVCQEIKFSLHDNGGKG